jgi:hypothetical protein
MIFPYVKFKSPLTVVFSSIALFIMPLLGNFIPLVFSSVINPDVAENS